MPNSTTAGIYEFGEFVLDGTRMLLRRRDGEVVALPPKALDLLQMFVEKAGRLLTKDELLSEVWRGVIVEEGNLTQNISILRKALGETSREHRYIVTVSGRGYRFVASVKKLNGVVPRNTEGFVPGPQTPVAASDLETTIPSHESSLPAERHPAHAAERRPSLRPRKQILLAALVFAGLGLFVAYALWTKYPQAPASVGEVKSIAVLPFATIGMGEEEEYLGVGLADALITKLSNIRQFVVRPTNAVARYADQKSSLSQVGRELGVDALLDGHVQRSGDRVRVTVQLVRSSDGVPLWAESFDDRFTNLFAVQDSISSEVAQALTLKLTGEEQKLIRKRPTENAEAYQLYLKGRYFWNKRTGDGLRRAIGHFEQAIGLDAKFALAYAGLAESYVILNIYSAEHRTDAFPAARDAALKALAIDDTLAPAHTVLALVKVEYEYDWTGAERAYKKALELNPNYATAHHWYSEYLAFMGRFDESIAHVERAYELDPQSPVINTARGYPYMRAHRCDEAMGYFQKALEMERDFPLAHFYMGKCYAAKSQYEEAAREHRRAIEASGESAMLLSALGFSYARSGKVGEARAVLEKMKESARRGYVSPYSFATIYAGLGNDSEALEWLQKALEDRDLQLATLKDDIHFESLRHDPQFKDLLQRVGLAP